MAGDDRSRPGPLRRGGTAFPRGVPSCVGDRAATTRHSISAPSSRVAARTRPPGGSRRWHRGILGRQPTLPVWRLALAWVLSRARPHRRGGARGGAGRDLGFQRRSAGHVLAQLHVAAGGDRCEARRPSPRAKPSIRCWSPTGALRHRSDVVQRRFRRGARSSAARRNGRQRHGEAADHFEAALAANQRIESPPLWVAHRTSTPALLLARGRAADHPRALDLLGRAVAAAREMGMTALLTER